MHADEPLSNSDEWKHFFENHGVDGFPARERSRRLMRKEIKEGREREIRKAEEDTACKEKEDRKAREAQEEREEKEDLVFQTDTRVSVWKAFRHQGSATELEH